MRGRKSKELKFKNLQKSHKNNKFKTLKQLQKTMETEELKYMSIFTNKSARPPKKLCDITGLPAKYTCPRTGLYFFDTACYDLICESRMENNDKIKSLRFFGADLNPFKKKY
ncbi:hypothetical protein TUBRATIS_22720 [Tubulinosema ratisbonensis]|uniref:Vps72/YL1 C-terminal domain-containing protein n=1 Tax=Tubulinosema ratisbonensis TaxID=291195 RepID=A0A437AJD1_9MICR|nr:hypothetical protein TUBRATIS_22720 [Tubulinosema ratisbonensis]